jgi:hypothetical protein
MHNNLLCAGSYLLLDGMITTWQWTEFLDRTYIIVTIIENIADISRNYNADDQWD